MSKNVRLNVPYFLCSSLHCVEGFKLLEMAIYVFVVHFWHDKLLQATCNVLDWTVVIHQKRSSVPFPIPSS